MQNLDESERQFDEVNFLQRAEEAATPSERVALIMEALSGPGAQLLDISRAELPVQLGLLVVTKIGDYTPYPGEGRYAEVAIVPVNGFVCGQVTLKVQYNATTFRGVLRSDDDVLFSTDQMSGIQCYDYPVNEGTTLDQLATGPCNDVRAYPRSSIQGSLAEMKTFFIPLNQVDPTDLFIRLSSMGATHS